MDLGGAILNSEHLEQVRLVSWFRKTYPDTRILAIPNGGIRSASAGANLKAEGVSAGVPDLVVPEWLLWVEMKRETGGTASPAARGWSRCLESIGRQAVVGRGFGGAREEIRKKAPIRGA